MSTHSITLILGNLANIAMVLLVAPLMEGMIRKVTARIQSRQGPPLCQPYFDLLKLLGKEDLESGESPVVQRFAALLALAVVLTLSGLAPLGTPAPFNEMGDIILLVYLLTLCGIATLLAGLAAGSTYSLLGISREMMSLMTLEPVLVVALIIGSTHAASCRLDAVFNGSMYAAKTLPWSGLIMLGVLVFSFQAFVQRIPFDIAGAETELMEGPLMEYSGPKLALFKLASMAKLVIYSALVIALFAPWGQSWVFPLNWIWFWVKVVVLVLGVTAIGATHARYRIDQAIRYYASLLVIALGALILAVNGY